MRYNVEEMKKYLRNVVNEDRYEHCLLVADEAVRIANIYQLYEEMVYVTALNHDIAKDFSNEENRRLVQKYNLNEKILDDSYSNLIHADVGAVFVKEKYEFEDMMCEAIKYHTFGNPNMDLFAKVIFIADKIGRRNLRDVDKKIKEMAYVDIDKAIILYIDELRKSLKIRNLPEQEGTRLLYDKLLDNSRNDDC